MPLSPILLKASAITLAISSSLLADIFAIL
jgi:hypothetical protein